MFTLKKIHCYQRVPQGGTGFGRLESLYPTERAGSESVSGACFDCEEKGRL